MNSPPNSPQTAGSKLLSALRPFSSAGFCSIWLATVAGFLAAWIQDVSQNWLITSMTQDALVVSLVQVADTLPSFLLAFPAGTLADLVDRRIYLLWSQAWMVAVALCFAAAAILGLLTPWLLLALIFALGAGSAMSSPAWSATYPELVRRDDLPAAIALGSVSLTLSRIIGPALGGALVAWSGAGGGLLAMAAACGGGLLLVFGWRHKPVVRPALRERLGGAVRAGVHFTRSDPGFRAVLVRTLAFMLFGNAGIALLPLIVRQELQGGPEAYGILWAATGIGGLLATAALGWLCSHMSRDLLVRGATLVFAATLVALGTLDKLLWAVPVMAVFGAVSLLVTSTLQASAQLVLPNWIQARGMALFYVTLMGGMAGGSALWGYVAQQAGIATALYVAAGGAVLAGLATWPFSLGEAEVMDLTPAVPWPKPTTLLPVAPDRGSVMVTVHYRVQKEREPEFVDLLCRRSYLRKRDGAASWGLYQDAADPAHFIEYFVSRSWREHLLQHERITVADEGLEAEIAKLLVPGAPPVVEHFVTPAPILAM